MAIKITLENQTQTDFCLSYHYEEYIQAFLYRLNDPEFGDFLHNTGYICDNRTFRLFSFSRILEKPLKVIRDKHKFIFKNPISFIVSTVDNEMLTAMLKSIYADNGTYRLGQYQVTISALEFISAEAADSMNVVTLSPVCVYSTGLLQDGRKRTIYYEPEEKEFSELIRQNAIKKYRAYKQQEPISSELKVTPLGRCKEVKSLYKGFYIKGYTGRFQLTGSPELIQIILEAGMGGKNAEGKGMILPEDVWKAGRS